MVFHHWQSGSPYSSQFLDWRHLSISYTRTYILRCGATKTIALGFPMITVLFGSQPDVGLLSLPLLIYHPSQIMIGSLLIKPLKAWVGRAPPASTSADPGEGKEVPSSRPSHDPEAAFDPQGTDPNGLEPTSVDPQVRCLVKADSDAVESEPLAKEERNGDITVDKSSVPEADEGDYGLVRNPDRSGKFET